MNSPHPALTRLRDDSPVPVRWHDDSPLAGDHATLAGLVSIRHGVCTAGKSAGLEVLWVDTGAARTVLLPGRGMGIWQVEASGVRFGWQSPIDGPVHPHWVPTHDPDGLGWLEGFDELVVRCGLESNGAPERSPDGTLRYPLHGRIGNLPASDLRVEVDRERGRVAVVGEVLETKLFFKRLRLRSRIEFTPGAAGIEWVDEVTNELSTPATVQLLYHVNVGGPVLGAGARVVAPIATVVPKDDRSAGEVDRWNEIGPPESGYGERVYFTKLLADRTGDTAVMLRGAEGDIGLGLTFATDTLPYFVLWKNTAATQDGYVVGLEPATNLPNSKSFETQRGRVVKLAGQESVRFRVGLEPLVGAAAVQRREQQIQQLRGDQPAELHDHPDPAW